MPRYEQELVQEKLRYFGMNGWQQLLDKALRSVKAGLRTGHTKQRNKKKPSQCICKNDNTTIEEFESREKVVSLALRIANVVEEISNGEKGKKHPLKLM